MQISDQDTLHVAIIQENLAWENPWENFDKFEKSFQQIQNNSVNLVVLPETFSTGFTMNVTDNADRGGETLKWMKKWANKFRFYIAGSIIKYDHGNFRNRLYVVSPEGEVDYYDKHHLFRMGRENHFFSKGNNRVVTKIGNFRIILQICYDLRFPVFVRNRDDYDIILYVANFPTAREHVWNTLLPARAIENQAFVIAANSCGIDGEGVENCGKSCVIDMKGKYKARLNNEPGILISSIQLSEIKAFRDKFPTNLDSDNFNLLLS